MYIYIYIVFTNPSARVGHDTWSIFKRSLAGLNSEFSFTKTSCLTKAEEPSLSYYIYIYIYGCVCVVPCVCMCSWMGAQGMYLISGIFESGVGVSRTSFFVCATTIQRVVRVKTCEPKDKDEES